MWPFNKPAYVLIVLLMTAGQQAQDLALTLAEKFEAAGEYEEAITEFKRYVFFHGEDGQVDLSDVYARMGMAFGNAGRWNDAVEAAEKSVQTACSEKTRDERRLTLAAIQISTKNYSAAKFLLLKLEMYSSDEDLRKNAYFLHGVCCLYEHKWTEARLTLDEYFKYNSGAASASKKQNIDSLLEKALLTRAKSPSLAKWLSTFLPGAGQIYCGDWLNGLNALALNAAIGYLIVTDLQNKQVQDALFNALFLFQRFYQGNRTLAENAARQYNERYHRQWAEKILNVLRER